MATKDQTNIIIADSGGGNAVTIEANDFEAFEVENERPEVQTAEGFPRGYGFRSSATINLHRILSGANWGVEGTTPNQDVYAAMRTNAEKRITITYADGVTHQYDPVLFKIVPRALTQGGIGEKLWAKSGAAGTPPTGYDDLGAFANASGVPTFGVEGEQDRLLRQRFSAMTATWEVLLFGEVSSTLDGYGINQKLALAVELGRSSEDYFELVGVRQKNEPRHSEQERVTRATFAARWYDPRGNSEIIMPSSPEEVFFGVTIMFQAGGLDKSYLTIT